MRQPESCHLGTSPERPEGRQAPWSWLPWEGGTGFKRKTDEGSLNSRGFQGHRGDQRSQQTAREPQLASSEMGVIGQLAGCP